MRRVWGVSYLVALDNEYATWNAFQNQYWPAKYLIDRNGHLRCYHFGEGEYDTGGAYPHLLGEERRMPPVANRLSDRTPRTAMTPETYLGYERLLDRRRAGSRGPLRRIRLPDRELEPDELAYAGAVARGRREDRRGA